MKQAGNVLGCDVRSRFEPWTVMASACVIVRQCMLRHFIKSLLQSICESGSVVLCKIRMVQLLHAIYLGNFECFIVVGANFFHTAVNQ